VPSAGSTTTGSPKRSESHDVLLAWLCGLTLVALLPSAAQTVPSICEDVAEGITVVRDDVGMWRGDLSYSITHQSAAPYQARKILDLTNVKTAGVGTRRRRYACPRSSWSATTRLNFNRSQRP